jgi:hypothetical protein
MARVRGPEEAHAPTDPLLSGWHAVVILPQDWTAGPGLVVPGFQVRPAAADERLTVLHDVDAAGKQIPTQVSLHLDLLGSLAPKRLAALFSRFRVESWKVSRAPQIDRLDKARAALGVDRSNEAFHTVVHGGGGADAPWADESPWYGAVLLPPGVHELRAEATVVGRVSDAEPESRRTVRVAIRVATTSDAKAAHVPVWGPIYDPP